MPTNNGATYIPEVPVEHFDISVNDLKCYELVVPRSDPADEEQRRISAVYDLRVYTAVRVRGAPSQRGERTLVFQKVAHARAARKDELRNVLDDLGLLLLRHRREPFRETDFPYASLVCQFLSVLLTSEAHLAGRPGGCR